MEDRLTRILLGPYRSGKTVALLKELTDHCRGDVLSRGDALLIVPSKRYQRLVEGRISELISADGDSTGYMGLNIASFYQACNLILRRCGIITRVIPEAVRPALVARVLSDLNNQGRLEHLLPIVDFVGTHAALLELIDELERSGLSPSDVVSRLESSASQSSRHAELALVYKGYWQELDRIGYLDNRRLAFKCREVLSARPAGPDTTKLFGYVGVDGFDRFNHLQLQVLKSLSRHCGKTNICFDYSDDEADLARREYMWKDTSFADVRAIFSSDNFQWQEEPGPVAANAVPAPAMEAFKTVDRFLEMEEVARRVKHSLVVKGLSHEQILVVVPSLRDYKGAIEAAFDDAGVPYFVDESIRMLSLPIVQFALSLLHANECDFARGSLVRMISSRNFNRAGFNLSSEDVARLDKLSQKEKVIGGRSEWLRVAECAGLKGQMEKLLDCLTPPPSHARLIAFVSWSEDVLSSCLVLDDELGYQDPVQSWTEERALLEIQNLWASVVQEDAILYGDKGGFKSDYVGFLKKISHAFEKANFRAAPAASNSVKVSSVDLADNRLYDEVFLTGLVEGEFPRRIKGRGFVSADEVGRWESFGIDIKNPRMHPAFEYALFRSLINRSRQKIHLSYPMWDMSGEELLPSFFLTGESLPVKVVEAPPYALAVDAPVSGRNFIAGSFWNSGSRLGTISGDESIMDLYRQMEDSVAMVRARAEGALESPFNGYLADSVRSGALEVKLPSRFSASKLNEYGKCPFRYWMSNVLKLSPFEEATVKLEVRELGETYHLALEKFYDRLIEAGIGLIGTDRALLDGYFEASVEEALAWLEKKRGVNYGEFWNYEKKELVFRLKKFYEKEIERAMKSKIDYLPFRVEAAFGMNDADPSLSAPALKVTDGKRTVEFRGKIDRIDLAGGLSAFQGVKNFAGCSARVIDYKAGSTAIPSREANEGRNMQLPIYALAVERCVLPGSKVSTGSYLSFTSGGPIGTLKFEPDKEEDRAFVDTKRVEQFILTYVENMSNGVFTVAPNNHTVCESCDHKHVCRVTELRKGGGNNDVIN